MTDVVAQRARELDANDPLASLRARFVIPQTNGRPQAYLCGNSLGLAPRGARRVLDDELAAWESLAVRGHFEGERPWLSFHEPLSEQLAALAGAYTDEVVCTGTLTANLHALLASFYRPASQRRAILIEADAFPSDRYAAATWVELHGGDPAHDLLIAAPASPSRSETDALLAAIRHHGERLATVFVGGVHYQTGELIDMPRIAEAAHRVGATFVVDLAHAMGNVPLKLNEWRVDGAAWCSYKYLNSGPGASAGLFIHREQFDAFRLGGWWGNAPETRFSMPHRFEPQRGAAGWQWSNAPIFSMAPIYASMETFAAVSEVARKRKARALFSFLVESLADAKIPGLQLVTPLEESRHGSQLSMTLAADATELEQRLLAEGVVVDSRPPNLIRVAPVPLYNSFSDVARFVAALKASQ